MFSLLLAFFCFWTCYSVPIASVETTVSSIFPGELDLFAKDEISAAYLNSLPPVVKKGILESRRFILSEETTKEAFMAKFDKDIKNNESSQESNKLLLKWLSALLDYSIWMRTQIKKQNSVTQEYMRIMLNQTQDERYLKLSPEDKKKETSEAFMYLNLANLDFVNMIELKSEKEEKKKELNLADLQLDYEFEYDHQQTTNIIAESEKLILKTDKLLVEADELLGITRTIEPSKTKIETSASTQVMTSTTPPFTSVWDKDQKLFPIKNLKNATLEAASTNGTNPVVVIYEYEEINSKDDNKDSLRLVVLIFMVLLVALSICLCIANSLKSLGKYINIKIQKNAVKIDEKPDFAQIILKENPIQV